MEKIAAAITVAFAAFCVVWAFIRQLNSDDDSGSCNGKCGVCPTNKKNKSSQSTVGDTPKCDALKR